MSIMLLSDEASRAFPRGMPRVVLSNEQFVLEIQTFCFTTAF